MIEQIFNPKSIAIIGASDKEGKWGNQILKNLILGGFEGEIFPINPKGGCIGGLDVYKCLGDAPNKSIEMAVIVIPAQLVPQAMKDCGQAGIKAVIIISAGFGELGNHELEQEVIDIAKKYDISFVGPNTFGTLATNNNMNVSLLKPVEKKGNVSIFVQSGTLGIVLADKISKMKTIGLNTLVSMGNMKGLDFADLITYAEQDINTKVSLLYMEDVKDGKRFIEAAKLCTKPIVVLRGGRSQAGSKATASHTGALAGSDSIYSAAFEQAGVIQVENIDELFIAAEIFSRCPIPKGNRVGILSPGGGANILCVDFCEKYGIKIPEFNDYTQSLMYLCIPSHAPAPSNPVDCAASFDFDDYHALTYYMTRSDEIDIVITNFVMTDGYIDEWDAEKIPKFIYNSPHPVLGSWMGAEGEVKKKFEEIIPLFDEPAKAAFAAGLLVKQMEFLKLKETSKEDWC